MNFTNSKAARVPQLETSSVPTTATFATGGTTDVSKYIDIQVFLMAANGGGFCLRR